MAIEHFRYDWRIRFNVEGDFFHALLEVQKGQLVISL
jgi:hypothetical protein